jgi:hypothetical protein
MCITRGANLSLNILFGSPPFLVPNSVRVIDIDRDLGREEPILCSGWPHHGAQCLDQFRRSVGETFHPENGYYHGFL